MIISKIYFHSNPMSSLLPNLLDDSLHMFGNINYLLVVCLENIRRTTILSLYVEKPIKAKNVENMA